MSASETFNLFSGLNERDSGIDRAASPKNKLLDAARTHLRALAAARPNRCVTADDAAQFLEKSGENLHALGNAAGALFHSPEWEPTGCWTPSVRVSNHARAIKVWRLK